MKWHRCWFLSLLLARQKWREMENVLMDTPLSDCLNDAGWWQALTETPFCAATSETRSTRTASAVASDPHGHGTQGNTFLLYIPSISDTLSQTLSVWGNPKCPVCWGIMTEKIPYVRGHTDLYDCIYRSHIRHFIWNNSWLHAITWPKSLTGEKNRWLRRSSNSVDESLWSCMHTLHLRSWIL